MLLKCSENKFLIDKIEFWSAAKELVRVLALDRELPFSFSEFKQFTPYATLQEIVCGKSFGGIGVWSRLITARLGSLRSLAARPAEKVGIKTDDSLPTSTVN